MAHEETRVSSTGEESDHLEEPLGIEREEEKLFGGSDRDGVTEGGLDNAMRIFSSVRDSFNQENKTREAIRSLVQQLENTSCRLVTHFSLIHQTPHGKLGELCNSSESLFKEAQVQLSSLTAAIPQNSYYKYHDRWKFVLQRLSFIVSLKVYLESSVSGKIDQALVRRDTVSSLLGGFDVVLEDYLIGLLLLAHELSRLAVNSVILGDYHVPPQIISFVNDLSSGFRLLNLKNDALRKKFDSLKYDTKKIEEVVYDMKIRGLI